ncbi:MAG: hypothetical protein JXR97_04295 [Planctomycetes bacterium]|nr:hypothetical protein [Planctomycetota bacterium]
MQHFPQTAHYLYLGFALFALLASACLPVRAGELPPNTIPNGLGMQVKTSEIDQLEPVVATGVRFIRRGFYWDQIEKEKGVYDFTQYDALMDWADAKGIRVIGCLFNNNKLHEDDKKGGIQTEAGRQGFAAWAAALAVHYKGRNIYWEIWNEPNVQTFWRKGKHNSKEFADEYSALVNAVAPAMVKADPDCFVMAGSVSNYWAPVYEWTENCFKSGVLQSGIRAWSVHPYGVSTPEEHAEGGGGGHKKMRELMRKYNDGKELPLITSERGFSVSKTKEGWSGGSKERAREFQAWHFLRQYLIDQMTDVRVTIWYEWAGKGDMPFGFVNTDGTPRPVYKACQNLVKVMSGYDFVERVKTDNALDYLLTFKNAKGEKMLVAWTTAGPKGKPDQTKDHEIELPAEMQGATKAIDYLGAETPIEKKEGKAVLLLQGGPKYVAY